MTRILYRITPPPGQSHPHEGMTAIVAEGNGDDVTLELRCQPGTRITVPRMWITRVHPDPISSAEFLRNDGQPTEPEPEPAPVPPRPRIKPPPVSRPTRRIKPPRERIVSPAPPETVYPEPEYAEPRAASRLRALLQERVGT